MCGVQGIVGIVRIHEDGIVDGAVVHRIDLFVEYLIHGECIPYRVHVISGIDAIADICQVLFLPGIKHLVDR